MKFILLTVNLVFSFVSSFAQSRSNLAQDTSIKNIQLSNVTVHGADLPKFSKKVKTQEVYIQLNSTVSALFDSSYFLTKFPKIEDLPIKLNSVEVKLHPFDTSLFDIKFAIFQITDHDTLLTTFDIDDAYLIRKNKLKISLKDEEIILKPSEFYLGYGFRVKKIGVPITYRLFSSTEGGEGAMIKATKSGISITSNAQFPYIFPFKIAYRKLGG